MEINTHVVQVEENNSKAQPTKKNIGNDLIITVLTIKLKHYTFMF